MASETLPHLGATVYHSPDLPATNDAAGFNTLTWVLVKGPSQYPQFGITNALIDIPDAAIGFTQAAKGAGTGQESTMQFREIPGDAGQIAIKANADAVGPAGSGALKVVFGSGAQTAEGGNAEVTGDQIQFAQGVLHSNIDMQGGTDTYRGFDISFRQNDRTVITAVA